MAQLNGKRKISPEKLDELRKMFSEDLNKKKKLSSADLHVLRNCFAEDVRRAIADATAAHQTNPIARIAPFPKTCKVDFCVYYPYRFDIGYEEILLEMKLKRSTIQLGCKSPSNWECLGIFLVVDMPASY